MKTVNSEKAKGKTGSRKQTKQKTLQSAPGKHKAVTSKPLKKKSGAGKKKVETASKHKSRRNAETKRDISSKKVRQTMGKRRRNLEPGGRTVPKSAAAAAIPGGRKKQPHLKRKKKKTRLWAAWIPLVAACVIIGFVVRYLSFDNLQPKDYIDITYSGYDSRGTAALSIQETEEYAEFLEEAEIRLLSENGNLKNGDLLEVHFLYDEEAAKEQKLRVKEDSFQIEVSGLPEGRELSVDDLFRDVAVTYEGTAPELSVAVANQSTDPFLQTVSYEIVEQKACYDLGDTFVLKATFSEEEAISHEYAVASQSEYEKEFTVEHADRYLRDSSQLTQEQIHILNETASTLFGDATEYGLRIFSEANLMPIWVNGKTTFRWSNPRLISAYLNVLKPEYFETSKSHNNDVKLVYKATLSQADGVACDAEVVVQFNDLIQKADGSYDLALDSGRIIAASFKDSNIRDLVTDSYAQEYAAEKLTLN